MFRHIGRILALMLAAMLALSAAALADDIPVGEPGGSDASGRIDFTESAANYAGRWVAFEDGFRLYVPVEWRRGEITEAQSQAGLFYSAGNGGGDSLVGEVPMGVAVSWATADGVDTLEELAADYEAAGFTEIGRLDLNGIQAVAFSNVPGDYRGVVFFHPVCSGYVLSVYVSPCGEGGGVVRDVGSAILCSLTPTASGE